MKTENANLESFYKRGGVTQTRLKVSSPGGKELRKDAALAAFAAKFGGDIELECIALNGDRIPLTLSAAELEPTTLAQYFEFLN